MEHYKRKILLDKYQYGVLFEDGSTTLLSQTRDIAFKTLVEGFSISGKTGPNINILVSFKQKTKDLGIYNDLNFISNEQQENIVENVIDDIIGNINIGGG